MSMTFDDAGLKKWLEGLSGEEAVNIFKSSIRFGLRRAITDVARAQLVARMGAAAHRQNRRWSNMETMYEGIATVVSRFELVGRSEIVHRPLSGRERNFLLPIFDGGVAHKRTTRGGQNRGTIEPQNFFTTAINLANAERIMVKSVETRIKRSYETHLS